MGCQASAPPVMAARKAGKIARRFTLSIGLLCSKTFDDAIFPELFEAKYGLARADIVKMNIKGVFQVWMRDGAYHEIPLKEAHAWTREGCTSCPDFAAEHADISTGGIGAFGDWTLTLLRTERGEALFDEMEAAGRHRDPAHRGRPGRRRAPQPTEPGEPQAVAGDRRTHAGSPAGAHCMTEPSPKNDEFAALSRHRDTAPRSGPHAGHHDHRTPIMPTPTAPCTAPSSTPWPAQRWPPAANDGEHSGIVSSVLVDYLQPAAIGDVLRAEIAREVSTGREDVFTGTVRRGDQGDLLAWVRARGTRRPRPA